MGPGFVSLRRLRRRVLKRANVIKLAESSLKPAVAQKPLRKHFSVLSPQSFPFSEPGPSPRPRLTFSDYQSFHPPLKKIAADFFLVGLPPPLLLRAASFPALLKPMPLEGRQGCGRAGGRCGRRRGEQRRGVGGRLALGTQPDSEVNRSRDRFGFDFRSKYAKPDGCLSDF